MRLTKFLAIFVFLVMPAVDGPATAQLTDAGHRQFVFAYRLLQLGDDKLAAEAFDEYLSKHTRDEKYGDALYYRALLYRQAGDNTAAAKLLARTIKPAIVPGYAVQLLRGQVHVDMRQYEPALQSLEKVNMDELPVTVRASALFMRGLAYRGAGNPAGSAASLEAAAKLESPLKAQALLELARLHVAAERVDQALQTLEQCLAAGDPAVTPKAATLAGDLAYEQGRYSEAIAFYRPVLAGFQSSSQFGAAVVGTLWSHFSAKDYQAVVRTFERYDRTLTDPGASAHRPAAVYLAASAHHELGHHGDATALLNSVLSDVTGTPLEAKVLFKLAASYFELGQYGPMSQTLVRLRARHADSPFMADADFLLASADARQNQIPRAIERLSLIINQGNDHPYFAKALLQRAQLYERGNQLDKSAADYERYLAATAAQRKDGSPIDEKTAKASLRLLDAYQHLGEYRKALTTATELLHQPGIADSVKQEALYRRALALVRLKQREQAIAALDDLLSKYPENPYVPHARYYRGLLAISLDSSGEQAVTDLLAAARSGDLPQKMTANAWRFAAVRLQEQGRDDAAAEALLALDKLAGPQSLTVQEQLWLARYFLDQNGPELALQYLKPILDRRIRPPARLVAETFFVQGQSLRALGRTDAAIEALRQVIAMDQGLVLEARLQLAVTLADAGRIDDALNEYAGLTTVRPSGIAAQALYNSAALHQQRAREFQSAGDVEAAGDARRRAYTLLKKLVLLFGFRQLSPLPERAYLEIAELAEEMNQAQEATSAFTELAAKYPDTPHATYARAMLALRDNKQGEAIFMLKKLRQEAATSTDLLNSPEQGSKQPPAIDPALATRVGAILKKLEVLP